MDAPETVWRAHLAGQIAHLHECFEERQQATEERVEHYHAENIKASETLLLAIGEVKAMALPAFTWTSAEEKQREKDALIEAGKQLERERWVRYLHHAQDIAHDLWDWVGKPAIGAAALYIVYQVS